MKTLEMTRPEAALLLALVGSLNPDTYKHSDTKSLIYKVKGFVEALPQETFVVVIK